MAGRVAPPEPVFDKEQFKPYLADEGLKENGSVPVYLKSEYDKNGDCSEIRHHQLRDIAWRFLEDLGVGVVAFNTPKRLHCLSLNQQVETFLILEHAKRDARVKALVWTSTGTKAFNSGASLKGDQKIYVEDEVARAYNERGMAPSADMVLAAQTKAFWDFPKPIVMAVNGLAVGGGVNVALANYGDIVFCSDKARFMYPFARLGLTPELGSSMVIPWMIGMTKAKELMMAGDWLSAEEAHRLNLVNAVCKPDELIPTAVSMAAKIGRANATTLKLMKQLMNAPLREHLDKVLAREATTIIESVQASGGFKKNSKL